MNSRARKLRYIRKKNSIRKGLLVRGHFLISVEATKIEGEVDKWILEKMNAESRIYKTPLVLNGVNVGMVSDQPDMIAIKYTLIAESHKP